MKILVLGPNKSKSHNRHYEYLKLEMAEQHEVCMFGYRYKGWMTGTSKRHIDDIINWLSFEPDVIMTFMAKYLMTLKGLRDCKLPTVHWAPDYVPLYRGQGRTLWIGKDEDRFIEQHRPELVLCPNLLQIGEVEKQHPGTMVGRFPFSVDSNIFKHDGRERNINVTAVMSTVPRFYKNRVEIVDAVDQMPCSFSLGGGKGPQKSRVFNDQYIDLLSQSKIVINATSLKHTDFRPLNPRFLEISSCGAMLLTEPADDMKIMGFKPGINCDTFNDIDEMKEKIDWYLENDDERERVAGNGKRLTREYHSCERRVKQLTKMIERITQ